MTTLGSVTSYAVPSYVDSPRISISFRMFRDGEVSSGEKTVRIFRDWDTLGKLDLSFTAEDGEFSQTASVDLGTLLAQGDWLVMGKDPESPKRLRAGYVTFMESGIYPFNITNGAGGQQGEAAEASARVRVDKLQASREVVFIERPSDGEWRLAGYGPTPGGAADIGLRVVGGDVYAMAVDDYGVRFVADLAVQVGQRIRPTQYTGWVYEITEAGQLPAVEPAWWAAVGENPSQPLGTARAVARRYFQPIALGPGPVEVV